jgi:hypothetical protein
VHTATRFPQKDDEIYENLKKKKEKKRKKKRKTIQYNKN